MEQKNARQDEEDERQSITRGESNRLTEEVGEQVGRRLHGQANGKRRRRGEERKTGGGLREEIYREDSGSRCHRRLLRLSELAP